MDTITCEKRMRGEGWGVGDGPAGNDDQFRRPARMAATGDALSVHIASLGETWYEPLVRLPTKPMLPGLSPSV